MASKQQSSHQSQNLSSASSQSKTQPLIFSNVYFSGNIENLERNFKHNYKGVKSVIPLYLDNDGKSISAIQVDIKSDDFAGQFFDKNNICIGGKEHSIKSLPRSVVVSKVSSGENEAKLLQDIAHNYLDVEKISRFYNLDRKSIDKIRIDFKSDASPTKILKDNYIFIDGKRCPVQPYWSLTYIPSQNQNEKDHASEKSKKSSPKQPQTYLTEEHVKELFKMQQMQLEAMINEFDNKWNARLSSLTTSSTNTNADQLLPIVKDLTVVSQQFNQQNAQMQKQLGSVVHPVRDVQMTLNTEQTQKEWPQLPVRNGH